MLMSTTRDHFWTAVTASSPDSQPGSLDHVQGRTAHALLPLQRSIHPPWRVAGSLVSWVGCGACQDGRRLALVQPDPQAPVVELPCVPEPKAAAEVTGRVLPAFHLDHPDPAGVLFALFQEGE